MGALAATAQRGRSARGGLVARSAWRMLVLLGFACAAVILFGTAANADSDTAVAAPTPASKPGLVRAVLTSTNALLHGGSVSTPSTGTPSSSLPAVSESATGAAHQATSSTTPAAHVGLPILAAVAPAPAAPVSSAAPVAPASPAALPLHDTLTPVVAAATHGLTDTVDVLTDTTSSLPVLGLATTLLRDAGTATTGAVVSTVDSLTTHLDTQLATVVATTGHLVAPLTGGGKRGLAAGPGSATDAGGPSAPPTVAGVPDPAAMPVLGAIRVPVPAITPAPTGTAPGALPAPPRSVGHTAAVQSAPVVVAAYAALALGAVGTATGTMPGPAAGATAGGHDQTEVPRGFDFRTVMAIGRPAAPVVRPLPGNPLVDPGFSPD